MTRDVSFDGWKRNQAAVTIATFIGFTGFTLVMPFLPLYFAQLGLKDPGEIAIWSGLSLGVTPAITAAMAPFWAKLADRYGRKPMVGRSLASFVVIMALMAAVQRPWHVLALRTILGFFAGYGPIAMTMAAESAPPEYIATAIGWVQTAQRLGPALGPVIGGALASALGLRETFLVASLLYLGAFLLVLFTYREVNASTGATQALPVVPPSFAALRRVPHFVLFLGAVFGLQMVDRSFGPVLPLYLGAIGVPDARVAFLSGVIFATTAGAAAFGHHTAGWWLSRMTTSRVVALSSLVGGVGAAVFGLAPPIAVLIAIALVFGFGIGVATTAVYTAATRAVRPAERGVAFGYLTTAYLIGLAVSPVVAGMIGSFSMRAVFFVDGIGMIFIAWIVRRRMGDARAQAGVPAVG